MGVGRLIKVVLLVWVLVALLAQPALAADDARFFRLKASVDGGFTVDYGDPPDPNTSDYSGEATTSYSTDLVSVARYRRGAGRIEGKFENTKGRARHKESTSVVSHFPGGEPHEFECDNGRGSQQSSTTIPSPGMAPHVVLPYVRDVGSVTLDGGAGGSMDLAYALRFKPSFNVDCFDAGHSPLEHYLHSPDSSAVLLADTSTVVNCCRAPRGAFNPNSDREYEETFSRNVRFEDMPNPHPGEFPTHPGADYPHTFEGSSTVTFEIDLIKRKKAEKLRDRFKKLPKPDDWTD